MYDVSYLFSIYEEQHKIEKKIRKNFFLALDCVKKWRFASSFQEHVAFVVKLKPKQLILQFHDFFILDRRTTNYVAFMFQSLTTLKAKRNEGFCFSIFFTSWTNDWVEIEWFSVKTIEILSKVSMKWKWRWYFNHWWLNSISIRFLHNRTAEDFHFYAIENRSVWRQIFALNLGNSFASRKNSPFSINQDWKILRKEFFRKASWAGFQYKLFWTHIFEQKENTNTLMWKMEENWFFLRLCNFL